uniref:G_PROTEIN_RECEP_F1_2 domain-containing protein n=1 Tax=Caenorhabditis japonica TaxID=281687 RepID=A0A8R1I580_CAEJA
MKEKSFICGFIALLSYDITSQTHVAISINRFIAVFAPFSYNTIYNFRATKLLILLLIIISTIVVIIYAIALDCQLEYNKERKIFVISENRKCDVMGWTMLFGKSLMFSIVDVVLHIITLIKVISMRRRTFGQTVFMSFELIAYILPVHFVSEDYTPFLLSIFLRTSIHAAEGVVTLIYNSDIRRKLRRRKKSYRISVTKVEQTTTAMPVFQN